MTDAQLIKWAENHGINPCVSSIKRLTILVDRYGKKNEHYCNGDPHYLNPDREDKNKNAELWDKECDRARESIENLAGYLGFDDVDFGVGLYPVFAKGNDTCIHLPD